MSYVTVVWSMVAPAGFTLAATHVLVVHCLPLAANSSSANAHNRPN
jgi:hypothetical protein